MSTDYDVIVIGVGGMGSAALYSLARRGARVCGIERFGVAHDRGSSHGDTRIIRKAYFEHPDYVPLLNRAYELWDELEGVSGAALFDRCGFLTVGLPESESIQGLETCYAEHRLPHERLTAAEIEARFPQMSPGAGTVGFWDPTGGYLRVEDCVTRHVEAAVSAGADLHTDTRVLSWEATDDGVIVRTDEDEIAAKALVLSTGAWAAAELRRLGVDMEIWRKVLFWYDTPEPEPYLADRFPTFYVEREYGHFYGFPSVDGRGVKVAEHLARTPIDDPDKLERSLLLGDEPPVQRFMAETFPGALPGHVSHAVCMYSVTPDWNFVIDRHPQYPRVVIAGGFSGHGFKFASVVGEIAGDLALDGRTRHPIDFLGLGRFGP